jgi:hypothetical protein
MEPSCFFKRLFAANVGVSSLLKGTQRIGEAVLRNHSSTNHHGLAVRRSVIFSHDMSTNNVVTHQASMEKPTISTLKRDMT